MIFLRATVFAGLIATLIACGGDYQANPVLVEGENGSVYLTDRNGNLLSNIPVSGASNMNFPSTNNNQNNTSTNNNQNNTSTNNNQNNTSTNNNQNNTSTNNNQNNNGSNFLQLQSSDLRGGLWQQPCSNGVIRELSFSNQYLTTAVYTFTDVNCLSGKLVGPLITVSPYTLIEEATDSTGVQVLRVEFQVATSDGALINRTILRVVDSHCLYFGQPEINPLNFDTSLNLTAPLFKIATINSVATQFNVVDNQAIQPEEDL